MNEKTLNSFIAAGNALLGEDFKGGDAALIMYTFDGAPGQYGIKGSAVGIGATLASAMAADADIYKTVVEATRCCERLKAGLKSRGKACLAPTKKQKQKQNENENKN